MLTKRKPYENKAIRKAARGEQCTLNSPWCNGRSETTVFCHLNEQFAGKGTAQKADDFGFVACSGCHDAYDRRINVTEDWCGHEDWYVLRAVYRTWRLLIDKGVKF